MNDHDLPAFWESRYEAEPVPHWDAGAPAPPFETVLRDRDLLPPPLRVVVPGCGTGHDAVHWAEAGHEVLGVDFASRAVAAGRARAAAHGVDDRCRFEQGDLFELGERYPAAFDVWLEYTCFCAIDSARRAEYARSAAKALRPGGLLVGLFYPNREGDDGPPFPVRWPHLEETFLGPDSPFTLVRREVPETSIERRRGAEQLVVMRREADRGPEDCGPDTPSPG